MALKLMAAEWSSGRLLTCADEGLGSKFEPQVGSPRIFKIAFHQLKLGSLSITCDVKQEGAFYSVFYAEASKKPLDIPE